MPEDVDVPAPGRETFPGTANGCGCLRRFLQPSLLRHRPQVRGMVSRRYRRRSQCATAQCTNAHDRRHKPLFHLTAVYNTCVLVYHHVSLTLKLGLHRNFPWLFLVAAVDRTILGADFLQNFRLTVDVARKRLVDLSTNLSVRAFSASDVPFPTLTTISALLSPYAAILREFSTLTQAPDWSKPVSHSVVHYIKTSGAPVFARPRRLAPETFKMVRAEFNHMLAIGVARPSSSGWSSPLHMAPKKTGHKRPCGDYRALNLSTVLNRYTLPRLHG
ncbi:uncharacterized protein LOC135400394 [Ornithodoros turicata]|uniref:uncharacterized protein LOC135400394 n=1 Tax=Ornithodoros turicata TaxID=34597 RepID=UPI0031393A60